MLKNFKGITLIALVVTIVVILILSGISITTLTGKNGIITQAIEAKKITEQAQKEELRKLAQIEASTHIEEYEYTDKNGKKIKIPAECSVSQIDGEDTIDKGLVIVDINGNEWVWIEVSKTIEIYKTAGVNITNFTEEEYRKIYEDLKSYTSDYSSSYTDEWYDGNGLTANESEDLNDTSGCGLTNEEYLNLKEKMLKSIYQEGGFFIGRYEVGIKEKICRNYGNEYEVEHPIEETPVIQANKYVYNWIKTSQAQELSERLAVGEKTSSLMFGIQWDLVLKYIETKNPVFGDIMMNVQQKLKEISSSWGTYSDVEFEITNIKAEYSEDDGVNYNLVPSEGYKKPSSNILLTTGATERNSVLGIYDLAGNIRERTLEKTTYIEYPCSYRGGTYMSYGSDRPASDRYYGGTAYNDNTTGFRPALY